MFKSNGILHFILHTVYENCKILHIRLLNFVLLNFADNNLISWFANVVTVTVLGPLPAAAALEAWSPCWLLAPTVIRIFPFREIW